VGVGGGGGGTKDLDLGTGMGYGVLHKNRGQHTGLVPVASIRFTQGKSPGHEHEAPEEASR
jgi:hypothetical protein